MFKRWKPKKQAALRITKNYDGIQFRDEYIIKQENHVRDIIKHIKSNPATYARDRARTDRLTGIPTIKLDLIDEQMPNDPTIRVLAEVSYTFTTQIKQKKRGFLLPAILILLASIIVFNIFAFGDIAKRERINAMCKVYYKHGKPTHIEFGNIEFDLNNLTYIDKIFMNPWTQQKLEETKISSCIQIHGE